MCRCVHARRPTRTGAADHRLLSFSFLPPPPPPPARCLSPGRSSRCSTRWSATTRRAPSTASRCASGSTTAATSAWCASPPFPPRLPRRQQREPPRHSQANTLRTTPPRLPTRTQVFEKLGPSLFDFLRRNEYRPFPLDLVQEFSRQLLESVQYLHELQLIHTDLKPENILLCSLDFCRASAAATAAAATATSAASAPAPPAT